MYQRRLSFMEAVKKVYLKNYFNFSGRASRSEFWWAFLAECLISMILYFLFNIVSILGLIIYHPVGSEYGFVTLLRIAVVNAPVVIIFLALLMPALGVTVRRLHDIDKSGWCWLVGCVPVIGWVLMAYWLVQPSEMGENRYGKVPEVQADSWTEKVSRFTKRSGK